MAFLRFLAGLCLMTMTTAATDGVRRLDFKNFVYPWSEPEDEVPSAWKWLGPADSRVRLVNGTHNFTEPGLPPQGAPYLVLQSVTYGDVNRDGAEEAAVDLRYGTGGTANWHYLYVYSVEDGEPRLMARLQSGSRAYGGLVKTTIRNRSLVVDFEDVDRRRGECCSDGYVRVTYRWQRDRFIEAGRRKHGDFK